MIRKLLIALSAVMLLAESSAFCGIVKGFEPDPQEWASVSGTHLSWATTDFSFNCYGVPAIERNSNLLLKGWRGEKVFAKALVWTSVPLEDVTFELSDLTGAGGAVIKSSDCLKSFMRNVISDYDKVIQNGCNKGKPEKNFHCDSTIVADCLDTDMVKVDMPAMFTQSIWVTCPIPANDYVGEYSGRLTVRSKGSVVGSLNLTVQSTSHVLPPVSEWKHFTCFWEHCDMVADYYRTKYFSEKHLEAMKDVFKQMAAAGQRTVGVTVAGPSSKRHVQWTLKKNGKWKFDYSRFDRYVELAAECGINDYILCMELLNRKGIKLEYFDEASGQSKVMTPEYDDPEYKQVLESFIRSFAKHLRKKGWFDRALIELDEVSEEENKFFFETVGKLEPKLKIKTALHYHNRYMESRAFSVTYASHCNFDPAELDKRISAGLLNTQYICCTETHPNRYVFSDPYECTYIAYNTFAKRLDGFTCWAVCSWNKDTFHDVRRRQFYAGEWFMFYPDGKSSQRWEKFIEGIQDYEKLHILYDEFEKNGDTAAKAELDAALEPIRAMAYNDTRIDIFDTVAVPAAMHRIKEVMAR